MTKLISWERAIYPRISSISEKSTPVILYVLHLAACVSFFFYQRTAIMNGLLVLELLCFLLLAVFHYRSFRPTWLLVLMGLNVIFLPLSLLKHGGRYGLSIVYFGLVVALVVFNSIAVSRKTLLAIHLTVAMILTFLLGVADRGYNTIFYRLLGNEVNPNTYGILAFACMLHWLCAFEKMRIKVGYRLLGQFCGWILGLYYIMHSNCRSVLLASAILLLLQLVIWRPVSSKFRWWTLSIIAVVCLVFTVVYVVVYKHVENFRILNKRLFTGRERIWSEALLAIKGNFLLGVNTVERIPSIHNTMLQLWYDFGLIPVITVSILLGYTPKISAPVTVSKNAQIAFVSCMVIGFFESFLADPYLYIFFLPFLLTNVRSERQEIAL